METLGPITVVQGGALSVLTVFSAWCLWAILSGRLIPRSWVDAMRAQDHVLLADKDARLADANEALRIERAQKQQLMDEVGATVLKTLRSLPDPGGDLEDP